MVVTNAYLNDLSTTDERDKVSSRGWALGYLGGGILLLIHLLWFGSVKDSGGDTSLAVRLILASTGIWWVSFALIPMSLLPGSGRSVVKKINIRATFLQLLATLRHMASYRVTLLFFISYLFYNDAVQTVIVMASAYGQEELRLGLDVLTKAILMVQFVAMGGSLLFERIAAWIGAKNAILISLLGWIGVVVAAYAVVTTEAQFYILAFIIALVLGGTQALSRSIFSQLIPPDRTAEYFSLYEISDRGTSWTGPLLFGIALTATGSYRIAILSLVILLVVGLALLLKVDVRRGIRELNQENK
jgi:UMF1 family MFS transporter